MDSALIIAFAAAYFSKSKTLSPHGPYVSSNFVVVSIKRSTTVDSAW